MDSCSKLGKGRLDGETGGENECLRETGGTGDADWEGLGTSSQGVTSSTGPVHVLYGAGGSGICTVEVDLYDVLVNGDTGTG